MVAHRLSMHILDALEQVDGAKRSRNLEAIAQHSVRALTIRDPIAAETIGKETGWLIGATARLRIMGKKARELLAREWVRDV